MNSATTLVDNTTKLSGIGLAVAASVALLVSIALWRTVSKPVQDLEAGMEAVAAGQFDYRLSVSPTRNDEFGRLAASYKSMAAQLAQLDKLKAEFVSVASHELKTPINVILGYLQLLNEGVYGSISAKQGEILRTVDAQTRSLSRLVHQLLDISRFEAGGGKLDLRPTELGHFLSDLESTFEVLSIAARHQLPRRAHRAAASGSRVGSGSHQRGARQSAVERVQVHAKDGTVELEVQAEGGQIRVTVRDTGAGIPPEQLPHIFRKFFQADNQHSAAHDGTGLGLAIAKQIVDAHGGKLTVESRVGEGTTFSITLPVRTGPQVRAGGRRPRRTWTPAREDWATPPRGAAYRSSDARTRMRTGRPRTDVTGWSATLDSAQRLVADSQYAPPTRCSPCSRAGIARKPREATKRFSGTASSCSPRRTRRERHAAPRRSTPISRRRIRRQHRAEAIALQRTTRVIDSLCQSARSTVFRLCTSSSPTIRQDDRARAGDGENGQALQDSLNKTTAELDRIKKRLSTPESRSAASAHAKERQRARIPLRERGAHRRVLALLQRRVARNNSSALSIASRLSDSSRMGSA